MLKSGQGAGGWGWGGAKEWVMVGNEEVKQNPTEGRGLGGGGSVKVKLHDVLLYQ